MLSSKEQYILSTSRNFKIKVEMVGIKVAGVVAGEDVGTLSGGGEERIARWSLVCRTLNGSEGLVDIAAKAISVALRDELSVPSPEGANDTLNNRVNRMVDGISDSIIESVMLSNWSSMSGFDLGYHIHITEPTGG